MSRQILVLGANGFIGSHLVKKILSSTDWNVYGMDIHSHKLEDCIENSRFHFIEGDITVNEEWIASCISKCDTVLPLAAIANPAIYLSDPIRVFELDFEANLKIIRQCVNKKKRVIFPSTSEVYGISDGKPFDEDNSPCTVGPVQKQRWIYSCSKQLLDRIIYAYGVNDKLSFTIFRPFNWIGPKLDDICNLNIKTSRVVTRFISNVLYQNDIHLVNGGMQRRSFTDIDDGIEALFSIILNKDGCAEGKIFNIGNPNNNTSIRELAVMILDIMKQIPSCRDKALNTKFIIEEGEKHYGQYYEDTNDRIPSIKKAHEILQWTPSISLQESLKKSVNYFVEKFNDLTDEVLPHSNLDN